MVNSSEQIYRSYSANFDQIQVLSQKRTAIDTSLKDADSELKKLEESRACDLFALIKSLFTEDATSKIHYSNLQFSAELQRKELKDIDLQINRVFTCMLPLKDNVLDPEQAKKLIIEACGGQQNSLKEIAIDNVADCSGWISIREEGMVEPIMRFKDAFGRIGIAVCAKSRDSGRLSIQTFYQLEANTVNWTSYGMIIPVGGYLISNGVLNVTAFEKFKMLVTDKLDNWKLAHFNKSQLSRDSGS
jgi:hypothetical protein